MYRATQSDCCLACTNTYLFDVFLWCPLLLLSQPKNSDRLVFLRNELQKIDFPQTFCIPLDSRIEVSGLLIEKCKFMDSKKVCFFFFSFLSFSPNLLFPSGCRIECFVCQAVIFKNSEIYNIIFCRFLPLSFFLFFFSPPGLICMFLRCIAFSYRCGSFSRTQIEKAQTCPLF